MLELPPAPPGRAGADLRRCRGEEHQRRSTDPQTFDGAKVQGPKWWTFFLPDLSLVMLVMVSQHIDTIGEGCAYPLRSRYAYLMILYPCEFIPNHYQTNVSKACIKTYQKKCLIYGLYRTQAQAKNMWHVLHAPIGMHEALHSYIYWYVILDSYL